MSALSAWCSMPPGITRHDAQHAVCEMRMKADPRRTCSCPDHPTKKDAG